MARWLAPLVVAAAGCGYSPTIPDAAPFQPLAIYAEWWAEARACTGVDARLERIRWYEVPVLPCTTCSRGIPRTPTSVSPA